MPFPTASEPRRQGPSPDLAAAPDFRHVRLHDQALGDFDESRSGGPGRAGAGESDGRGGALADRGLVPIVGEIIPERGQ